MFRLFSAILDKMGSWFGVIFKIIIPVLVMFLPTKLAVYSIYIFGVTLGGEYYSLSGFCEVAFYLVYAFFILMAILFPRVATVMEFIIIPYYLLTLILSSTLNPIVLMLTSLEEQLTSYWYVLPFVLVFVAFKIAFHFFISSNRDAFQKEKEEKYEKNNDYYA